MRKATMNLETNLSDGTSIKLDVSLDSDSNSLTASTTFTNTSLLFEIKDSQPSYHAISAPDQRQLPSNMPIPQLPKDIVAIDSGDRTYMFYVNTKQKLSYLISPSADGGGNYIRKVVDLDTDDIEVSEKTQQVAAIAWESDGVRQIRVYYVTANGRLSEVCLSSDKPGQWYQGSLGAPGTNQYTVAEGSSISATVARRTQDSKVSYSLRVFASMAGQENDYGVGTISTFTFGYDAKGQATGQWAFSPISNAITKW
ncbi:hypothetical protein FDECE_6909 [Fusarium decemcellulare]|nr:hypothetical protein FDECE_6909 [Fusarium decemcellulare]